MSAKRAFDIVVSFIGLSFTAPIFLLVAVIIKLESKGPVFYRCARVGKNGKLFAMYKFRSMMEAADDIDCKLCANGDVRVTRFGGLLRTTKLNELPQLLNVLSGDMSLVGPRPEDPKFVKYYKDKWSVVLSVPPGIAGPNQIANRNEEDLFPDGVDPEKYYVESILPDKLNVDVKYAENHSLRSDLVLLFATVYVTVFRGVSLRNTFRKLADRPASLLMPILDGWISAFAYLAANLLKYEIIPNYEYVVPNLIFLTVGNPLIFFALGLYKRTTRFTSVPDLLLIIRLSFLSSCFLIGMDYILFVGSGHSRVVYVLYALIVMTLLAGVRMMMRVAAENRELSKNLSSDSARILIYGAGRLGIGALRSLRFEPGVQVVGFVDDNPTTKGQSILGVRVLGTGSDLPFLRSLHDVGKAIIAFRPTIPGALEMAHQKCLAVGIAEVQTRVSDFGNLKETFIEFEDYRNHFVKSLNLNPIFLETQLVQPLVSGSAVAMVGLASRFGEEICRSLIRLKVSKIIVVEDSEAMLQRFQRLLPELGNHGVTIIPCYCPRAISPCINSELSSHGIDWVFYNRPNSPMFPAEGVSAFLYSALLSDMAGYLDFARQAGCRGFSFISSHDQAGYPAEGTALIGLIESFVRVTSASCKSRLRMGLFRASNLLDHENGIFAGRCRDLKGGSILVVPAEKLGFNSCENVANAFLNSLPLQTSGETLTVKEGIRISMNELLARFAQANGFPKPNGRPLRSEDLRQHSDSKDTWSETTQEGLLQLTKGHGLNRELADKLLQSQSAMMPPVVNAFLKTIQSPSKRDEKGLTKTNPVRLTETRVQAS